MSEVCKQEGRLSTVIEKVENLEGWQKSQNGSIHRVEGKVDKLAEAFHTLSAKFLTGIAVACVLLAINLVLGYLGG